MCGVGHHAPSGPPWTSTMVGSGASPAPAGEADPDVDRAAGAGRLDEPHLDSVRSAAARPSRRSTGWSAAGARRPVSGQSTVDQLHRPRAVGRQGGDARRAADRQAVRRGRRPGRRASPASSGRSARRRAGRSRRSSRKRRGCDRPRSLTTATIVASSSHHGPCRPETIQPVWSVSIQLPIGRSRSGAGRSARRRAQPSAGASEDRRADVVERLGGRRRRWPRPSARRARRPGGSPSRRAARSSRGSRVVRPPRRRRPPRSSSAAARSGSGPRSAGERDRPAVGMPGDVGRRPSRRS